jgi:hypothetical protein
MKSSIEIERLKRLPDSELFLYRYVTIDKLIDCLLNKRFPLTRLNLFEDKLEGVTPQHLLQNLASDKISQQIADRACSIFNIPLNINPTKRNSLNYTFVTFILVNPLLDYGCKILINITFC